MGHVLNKKDINAPNSRATDHYFHYYLVDEHGTPITTKGVKLKDIPQLPEIPVSQALQPEQPKLNSDQCLQVNPEQYSRWVDILNNISSANTQQDKMQQLLSMLESQMPERTSEEQAANTENTENVQPIIDLSHTLALLTSEVLELRQQVKELTTQRDEANAKVQNTDDTQAQITYLKSENLRLKQSQSSLLAAYNQLLANNNQTHQPQNTPQQQIKSKPLQRAMPAAMLRLSPYSTLSSSGINFIPKKLLHSRNPY